MLQGHANRYKRHIVPVMSLSVDFYVCEFVRIYTSPAAVKDTGCKLMYVYQSQGCELFFTQQVGSRVRLYICVDNNCIYCVQSQSCESLWSTWSWAQGGINITICFIVFHFSQYKLKIRQIIPKTYVAAADSEGEWDQVHAGCGSCSASAVLWNRGQLFDGRTFLGRPHP